LTLALLRAILTEGSVYYDGVGTSSVDLATLRSKITIIPQVVRFVAVCCEASLAYALQPELINGTIRHNLDMFEEHDDATLNDALHSSGLFLLQEQLSNRGLNLDTQVAAGGANLSIGQRQVLGETRRVCCCFLLIAFSTRSCDCTTEQTHHSRRSNFCHRWLSWSRWPRNALTSVTDHNTDAHIQESLRTQLGHDVTVLIVAHRLQTIMDAHKIVRGCDWPNSTLVWPRATQVVLDSGKLVSCPFMRPVAGAYTSLQVEFGSPRELLLKEGSFFRALVDESADREKLHALLK
jgi:hypothetical protein